MTEENGVDVEPFGGEEYAQRRSQATEVAKGAGLDGLVIWSRGAGTNERHANTVYLANAYSTFPFIPDNPPVWSGRGHSVLIITVDGNAELLLDVSHFPEDHVAIDNARTSQRIVEETIDALRRFGLDRGKIGLVGTDVLPVAWYWQIQNALPGLRWETADGLLDNIRAIKSPAEHDVLRTAARKGVDVITRIMSVAQPGSRKGDVMGTGLEAMARLGLMPYDLRLSTGPRLSDASLAGMPGRDHQTELRAGDLFRVDLVASYGGYYVDFARSLVVGQDADRDQQRLLDAAKGSVYSVIRALRPGMTGDELARIGSTKLAEFDLAPPDDPSENRATGFASFGHGLGLAWERPWLNPGSQDRIEAGMCLAIEQKVGVDGIGGATFEENVIVHHDGVEILTSGAPYAGDTPVNQTKTEP